MTADIESGTPQGMLERVCLVLDAFDGPGHLTLAQVVRRTGLPRSSTHRMLEHLVQLRWLRRQGRDYELGMRLVELGSLAVHQDRLHRIAAPLLHELHRVTGHAVHLAILDGADVVYLEKLGGRLAASLPSRVGGRQPAHCTAVGKAMLGFADADLLTTVDAQLTDRRTRYSITSPVQLRTELDKVRAHGFAYDREESVPGFCCVAAPVGAPGEAVAAVSVCGPVARLGVDHRLATAVRTTALAIWRGLDREPAQLRTA